MNAHHKTQQSRKRPRDPITKEYRRSGSDLRDASLARSIARIPFGEELDIVIPQLASEHLDSLTSRLEQLLPFHYRARKLNLAMLLEPEFFNRYLKTGSLTLLSLDQGTGDTVCIDGRGRMILSVDKDTYELLGLTGRPSRYGSCRSRFVIELPLLSPTLAPTTTNFKRTKAKLAAFPRVTSLFDELVGIGKGKETGGRNFDVLACWVDAEGKPGPIEFPPSVESTRVPTFFTVSTGTSGIPPLPRDPGPPPGPSIDRKRKGRLVEEDDSVEEWNEALDEAREWFSLVALADPSTSDSEDDDDEELAPSPPRPIGPVTRISLGGFFHPSTMQHVLPLVTGILSQTTSITLHPFLHSPISHLARRPTPNALPAGRKKRNGKTVRQGLGRGEEEESRPGGGEIGWEVLLWPRKQDGLTAGEERGMDWIAWEER